MQDRMFLLEYARRGPIAFVPEVLVLVGRGRSDHITKPASTLKAYEMILDKNADDFARWPDLKSLYHVRASREASIVRDLRGSVRHMRKARMAETPTLGRHLEFVLGLLLGEKGLSVYSHIRGSGGYG